MPRHRQQLPFSSFGNELYATLKKGTMEKVEIKFDLFTVAFRFQQRLHAMRAAMKRESHPDTAMMYRARTSLIWPEGGGPNGRDALGAVLTISPRDSEFADIVRNAGIDTSVRPMSKTEVDMPFHYPGESEAALPALPDDVTILDADISMSDEKISALLNFPLDTSAEK